MADILRVSDESCILYLKTVVQKSKQGFLDYLLHFDCYSKSVLIHYVDKYQNNQEEYKTKESMLGNQRG